MADDKYFKEIIVSLLKSLAIFILLAHLLILVLGYLVQVSNSDLAEFLRLRLDIIFYFIFIIGVLVIILFYFKKIYDYYILVCQSLKDLDDKEDLFFPRPLRTLELEINRIKREGDDLKKSLREYERKDDDTIIYLAHDLRTPLTSIIGYLNMLDEMDDMPEDQRKKYISLVLDKSLKLEELIDQFFEITRLNSGEIYLKKEEIDLEYLFIQLREEVYPLLEKKKNRLEIKAEKPIYISLDPEKIIRAFENLLKNALSYSYKNSEIRIDLIDKGDCVEIIQENQADTLDKAQLRNIFHKFTRLDNSRNSDKGGAGLGLPISKAIIEAHGGSISADSHDNKVVFKIILPKDKTCKSL